MNEKFAAVKTCAHPPCTCEVGPNIEYRSVQCSAMEETPDLRCDCHHKACKGNIGS